MKLPGLSEALSILRFERDEKIRGLAGDGFQVFYRSGELFPAYVDSPELVARNLLHLIIHNLYLHPLLSAGKDERLWNLACDMTAERLLDGWKIRGLSRPGNEYRALLLKEQQLPEQMCIRDRFSFSITVAALAITTSILTAGNFSFCSRRS